MNVERDVQLINAFEPKTASCVVLRVARLTLAIFVALVSLVCLCDALSAGRRQAQASNTAMMAQLPGQPPIDPCDLAQGIPARCRRPALTATKQITPEDPDTGSVVTITFVITGLGLKRLDVVLVQDVSGSMDERDTPDGRQRLEIAQEAAVTFVRQLSDTDRAGVVAYNDIAWLVQPLTSDKDDVTTAINGLPGTDTWTNIGAGLRAGYEELITSERYLTRTVKAIILLSDGGANRPTGDPECDPECYARYWATQAGTCGIMIYTIGLGQGVSEILMQDIADTSGGEYHFSPDGSDLGTIYQEIALELRNLVITDVLPPGVDLDCAQLPDSWGCITRSGYTTVTIPISDNQIMADDSHTVSFTTTVNLDPPHAYQVNATGSQICYDGAVITPCEEFENPTATVGGRMVTGVVFEDLTQDGHFDGNEGVLSGARVTASNGMTCETDSDGVYVFRTSEEPALDVALDVPDEYIATTSPVFYIDPVSGTYPDKDFGVYPVLDGISLTLLGMNPKPQYHDDSTTITYKVVNRDPDDPVLSGTIRISDSIDRTFVADDFALDPGGTETGSYSSFTVPRDISITLIAEAVVDKQGGLPVSARVISGPFCPVDIYEHDDSALDARPIYPGVPQIHDFYRPGDKDWVGLRLHPGEQSLYVFSARLLEPDGIDICLNLLGITTEECNASEVSIVKELSCIGGHVCDYYLQAKSSGLASGCGTDYELRVDKLALNHFIWLPVVLRNP